LNKFNELFSTKIKIYTDDNLSEISKANDSIRSGSELWDSARRRIKKKKLVESEALKAQNKIPSSFTNSILGRIVEGFFLFSFLFKFIYDFNFNFSY
jgi:hypothetical protein